MNKKFLLVFTFIAMLLVPVQYGHGHGLGLDTIKSISVGSKKITVTTQIVPTNFDDSAEKKIVVSVSDAVTNLNINNVVLLIGLYHDGKVVFEDSFFSSNGTITIDVNPSEVDQPVIIGERHSQLDAWHATESSPIELKGPVFDSGGLYHFEIERIAINESNSIVENLGSFFADVTLTTNQIYDEQDRNGSAVKFGVKSYYDKVSSFEYDPGTNSLSFEMPFDWNEQNISHVPVVHEEVHFPKDFSHFVTPSYVGKVNGIELFKSSVTIDDYSDENERIVHFVLSQDNLRYLKQAQNTGNEKPQNMQFTLETDSKLVFPVIAMTKDEQIQVDLSWDPVTIEPNKNTKLIFTFRDAKTGDLLRNTSYDLVISQNDKELYKKSANAQIGSDFADYTFSESQTGHVSIKFENLRGSDRSTEFSIIVVPEFGQMVFLMLSIAIIASLVIGNKKFRI
ncbi:MAG: PEFG-CTERM sorting domain-containing protein [Nitrososphaerota archaeon]